MEGFEAFPKIPRLSRECVVTEKIDGTNGQVNVEWYPGAEIEKWAHGDVMFPVKGEGGVYGVRAGSRNRWLTLYDDNYNFASWVWKNKEQLVVELGIGRHYGEWWGVGIGRRYDLFERRFSLFNTKRWKDAPLQLCSVVPVLYEGPFDTDRIDQEIQELRVHGSVASPGFMKPEGIVIYHKAADVLFKKTIEADHKAKGEAA